jgi:site-specific DNA recombinase
VERSRRGKLRKAREGKVIATYRPTHGFRINAARDGYEVDEEKMAVVRRVFRMVGAEGAGIYSVHKTLERDGVPALGGGKYWDKRGQALDPRRCLQAAHARGDFKTGTH